MSCSGEGLNRVCIFEFLFTMLLALTSSNGIYNLQRIPTKVRYLRVGYAGRILNQGNPSSITNPHENS